MPNFIEIGGGSRKFSKKLVDLTRNDPCVKKMSEKVKHRGKMLLLLQLQLAVRTFSICGSVCEKQNNVVQTQTIQTRTAIRYC